MKKKLLLFTAVQLIDSTVSLLLLVAFILF